jgi:hypothetical protein
MPGEPEDLHLPGPERVTILNLLHESALQMLRCASVHGLHSETHRSNFQGHKESLPNASEMINPKSAFITTKNEAKGSAAMRLN